MRRSTDRILTTHVGSLPRPAAVLDALRGRSAGPTPDDLAFATLVRSSVSDVVRKQLDAGVDIVSDGEMAKPAFVKYITDRLTGFTGLSATYAFRDVEEFPDFAEVTPFIAPPGPNPACEGPVTVSNREEVRRDVANLQAALGWHDPGDCFVPAASPGIICMNLDNHYYPTHEAYLYAVAEAMRYEYETLASAGFVIQLDSPDLAMARHRHFKDKTLEEFRKHSEMSIEALNYAVANVPASQLRLHVCWGNYEGPHTQDVELKDILDVCIKARVEGLSIEAANPRHEHEWEVFEHISWPDDKVLIPGVIDSTTNFVEHPRLVAQRIERFVRILGREHVIASTDCGFATIAGVNTVATDVVWAKLATLAEGARQVSI